MVETRNWVPPSLEKMRAEGIPPNVIWLKLNFWRYLPDAKMCPDGYSGECVEFLEKILPLFDAVKTTEEFKDFMEVVYTTALGKESVEEFRDEISSYLLDNELVRRTFSRCSEFLGVDLPNYLVRENLDLLVKKSRYMAGEDPHDLAKEETEAWEKERKEEESKRRKERKKLIAEMSGEEYVDDEESTNQPAADTKNAFDYPRWTGSLGAGNEKTEEQKARQARFEERRIWSRIVALSKEMEKESDRSPLSLEQMEILDTRSKDFVVKFGLSSLRFAKNLGFEERMRAFEGMDTHFSNIAKSLDMPTSGIGFRGALHVVYGGEKEGTGGVFTPRDSTLYISRALGAVVITHEWFHGLDFYLGRQAGMSETALSHMNLDARPPSSYLAPVFFAMADLMDFVKGNYEEASHELDAEKYHALFASWMKDLYVPELVKVSRQERRQNDKKRSFMLCQGLDSGNVPPQSFATEFVKMYAMRCEESEPEKAYILGDMQLELAAAADMMLRSKYANFLKGEKKSFLLQFAENMDRQQGRLYYAIPTEMIARLGEQFVFEKMGIRYPEHLSGQHACGPEKLALQKLFSAWVEKAKEYLDSPNLNLSGNRFAPKN